VIETDDISQRRACRLVSVDPKTIRREAVPDNPEARSRMREIAAVLRRFGHRRIGLMLEREGIVMNQKKLRRLYNEEGLSVKRRRGRKRATGTREPMLGTGRAFKALESWHSDGSWYHQKGFRKKINKRHRDTNSSHSNSARRPGIVRYRRLHVVLTIFDPE
jgi:hypothetical protein